MPSFDPNCFDVVCFDAAFSVPYMQKAVIGRGFRRLRAGSAIPIVLYIQQMDSSPGRLFSLNPTLVQVHLFLPTGAQGSVTTMMNKGVGVYEHIHQSLPT